MLSTIQEVSAELPQHSAETIGAVSEQIPDVPCIVPADPPVGWIVQWASWSRTIVSAGVSLLGHAGVLAWLGIASGAYLNRLMPVQQGQASIELTASVASASESSQNDTDPVEFEIDDPPRTRPKQAPVPMLSAMTVPVSIPRSVDGELPPVARASVPTPEAPCQLDVPVHPNRIAHEELPSEETPSDSDKESPIARTRMDRRPSVDVLAEPIEQHASTASQSSPASRAVDGAESIPAVVYNPAPLYPADALRARQTGRVVLSVRIASDGSVAAAHIHRSSGVPSLDQAALDAVRTWRFEPSGPASAPMRQAAVPIRFVITERDAGGN